MKSQTNTNNMSEQQTPEEEKTTKQKSGKDPHVAMMDAFNSFQKAAKAYAELINVKHIAVKGDVLAEPKIEFTQH